MQGLRFSEKCHLIVISRTNRIEQRIRKLRTCHCNQDYKAKSILEIHQNINISRIVSELLLGINFIFNNKNSQRYLKSSPTYRIFGMKSLRLRCHV